MVAACLIGLGHCLWRSGMFPDGASDCLVGMLPRSSASCQSRSDNNPQELWNLTLLHISHFHHFIFQFLSCRCQWLILWRALSAFWCYRDVIDVFFRSWQTECWLEWKGLLLGPPASAPHSWPVWQWSKDRWAAVEIGSFSGGWNNFERLCWVLKLFFIYADVLCCVPSGTQF